ncbi:hypothetical protein J4558_17155 [Leptolyngbya sp. 15MV]|nr:hypothetical protein J4558_17155 [Leptolyngbya sp. 15MV]
MRAMGLMVAMAAAVGCAAGATSALAQGSARGGEPTGVFTTTGNPMRDTLRRVTTQRMTIDFADKRLEDVINFIRDFSGADLEPLYVDDRNDVGLDKDRVISMRVENRTVLQVIERLMEMTQDGLSENTWQMTRTGAMQLGPKERLNRYKRLALYDIQDLLVDVPDFRDAPRIDLQQALQASQGGGGGGSGPFTDTGGDEENDRQQREQRRRELADELIRLITDLVEPTQWNSAGGEIEVCQGTVGHGVAGTGLARSGTVG